MPTGQAVEAVQTWLAAAGITEGPVFRSVLKGGRVQPGHLPGRFVATIVKRYAIRAGLDPAAYAGHSLRAGATSSRITCASQACRIRPASVALRWAEYWAKTIASKDAANWPVCGSK